VIGSSQGFSTRQRIEELEERVGVLTSYIMATSEVLSRHGFIAATEVAEEARRLNEAGRKGFSETETRRYNEVAQRLYRGDSA
jgi:hypothetical protein